MKYLIYLFLCTALLSSCIPQEQLAKVKEERAKRKLNKILKQYPHLIDTTTKRRVDTFFVELKKSGIIEDTNAVNKLHSKLDSITKPCDNKEPEPIVKSVPNKPKRKSISEQVKEACTIENLMSSNYQYDSTGISLRIFAKGNKIFWENITVQLNIKEKEEKTISNACPEPKFIDIFLEYWWTWLLSFLLGLILNGIRK